MNSSISSSRIALVFALTFALLFGAANVVLKTAIQWRTTADRFTQEIGSKSKHMRLNNPEGGFDAIFVGNSRTEYGISSAVFARRDLHVYNYGVAGAELSNYAHMTARAADLHPRTVVLSLPISSLYDEVVPMKDSLRLADVIAFMQAPFPPRDKFRAFGHWLAGINVLHVYADQVYARLGKFYRRFSPQQAVTADAPAAAPEDLDCDVISTAALDKGLTSYKCRNGDFIMTGVEEEPQEGAGKIALHEPDSAKLALLQNFSKKMAARGITLIYVLEPTPDWRYTFDADTLPARLGAPVIDLANLDIPARMWSDHSHLNRDGRRHYSTILAEKLTPLLKRASIEN